MPDLRWEHTAHNEMRAQLDDIRLVVQRNTMFADMRSFTVQVDGYDVRIAVEVAAQMGEPPYGIQKINEVAHMLVERLKIVRQRTEEHNE